MKQQYKSYQQTCEFLQECVEKYPDVITIKSIGKTWENRDIMLATISKCRKCRFKTSYAIYWNCSCKRMDRK